jgi:glycosyltransferase involved in cell wall biosynthesis
MTNRGSDGVKGIGKRVSVIIPTKNSAKTLETCLLSINKQTHSNLEIIIIDANSNDGTKELAATSGATLLVLDAERTKAKNTGIAASTGNFVFFVDSDMTLAQDVIENCMELFSKNDKIGGIVVPEKSVGASFWVKVRDFERSLYAGTSMESARFFRKDIVMRVNGFDEDVVFFEESTLPQKIEQLGFQTRARVRSLIYHDETGFNLKRWLTKKKYYTGTADAYVSRYGELARQQSSISYRIKAFTSQGKWKRLVRHPVLATGLFILKGLEYLYSRQH